MNQILKAAYGKGTRKQVLFMADVGGMNEQERQVLEYWHDQKSDLYIQEAMHIDKKTYERLEENVRIKMHIALFDCINFRMVTMDELMKK